VPLLLAALIVPYAVTFVALWTRTGQDLSFAQSERSGVVLLRPLVRLIAATADAQSSSTAGRALDVPRMRAAIQDMDSTDVRDGAALGTSERWTEVRGRLTELLASHVAGADGYSAFTEALDSEYALVKAIGDSSKLILDPALDSYYLMDTTLLRVPDLIIDAGRAEDIALLTEHGGANGRTDDVAATVAESEVRDEVTSIDDGLRKSFAATTSRSLGPGMLGQLDRLRDTATSLAPPTSEVGAPRQPRQAADVAGARAKVRDAALAIEQAGLDQLDALLKDRASGLESTRLLAAGAGVLGLLLAASVAWVRISRRRAERARSVRTTSTPDADAARSSSPSSASSAANAVADVLDQRPADRRQLARAGRSGDPGQDAR
jgi:hypothetical protein